MISLGLIAVWTEPSSAIYQQIREGKRLEAIDYGTQNTQTETEEFIEEWTIVMKNKKGMAFIITEFLALANSARDAILKGIALTPFDIEDAIAQSSGKFVFRVTTIGDSLNFAQNYTALLKAGDKVIQTTFWNNSEGEGLDASSYVADSDFYFPDEGVDPNSRIQLIIQDKDGSSVAEFEFDLSRMR